jgi:single-strand DNA-binding protein
MSFVNSITLIGNVGNDPEIKITQTGKKLCRLSLATTERYTKGGETQEKTLWHNITLWERSAEIAENHVKKGHKVYIEGRLNYNEWTDDSNQKRKTADVVANRLIILTPKGQHANRDQASSNWEDDAAQSNSGEENALNSFPF